MIGPFLIELGAGGFLLAALWFCISDVFERRGA